MEKYADLICRVSQTCGDERAAKCGYDLFMGMRDKSIDKRAESWERFILEKEAKQGHTDAMRDGVWVPAIME